MKSLFTRLTFGLMLLQGLFGSPAQGEEVNLEDDFAEFADINPTPKSAESSKTPETPAKEKGSPSTTDTQQQTQGAADPQKPAETLAPEHDPMKLLKDEADPFAEFEETPETLPLEEDAKIEEAKKAEAPAPVEEPKAPVPEEVKAPVPPPEILAPAPGVAPPPPVEEKKVGPPPPSVVEEPWSPPPRLQSSRFPDEPNYSLEKKLHEIYRTYNENPTPTDSWERVVGQRRSERYRVQKGDTLWDLSETLFGDPQFWPKLWSVNKQNILNPHEIESQMIIRFYPGDLEEPPTLGLMTETDLQQEPQKEELPIVLSRKQQPRPVRPLGKIPKSLPLYRMGEVNKPPIEYLFSAGRKISPPLTYLPFLYVDAIPSAIGVIKETELGSKSAGEFQHVYVEINDPSQKKVLAVKPGKRLGSGEILEIQGELEIVDSVSGSERLYRALVKKSVGLVQVGSMLIAGEAPYFRELQEIPEATALNEPLQIAGGIAEEKMSLFSDKTLVFLEGGKEQGLQLGQVLNVYSNQRARTLDSRVEFLLGSIGKLRIVALSGRHSTAFLVESTQAVFKGDWVGSENPQALAEKTRLSQSSDGLGDSSDKAEEELDLE